MYMVSFASCQNREYEDFNFFRKKLRPWFWLRHFVKPNRLKKSHLSFWSRPRSHDTNLFPQVDDISAQSFCKISKGNNETSHTNRFRSVLSFSCNDCSLEQNTRHFKASVLFTILATLFSRLTQELHTTKL